METFRSIGPLEATAGHIATVQATLDRLNQVKRESWEQLLTGLSRLFRDGTLDYADLLPLVAEMKESYGAGFTKLWDSIMPVRAGMVRVHAERERRDQPNGPMGSWQGTFPLFVQPTPPFGRSVVYVLFDEHNEPVYIGSTEVFRYRMAEHRATKPGLKSWAAYPCRDREHAYELEVDLLRQHKPRLNKKVGR